MKPAKKAKVKPRASAAKTPPRGDLLETLRARFEANMRRHPGVDWNVVRARIAADPAKLRALAAMEESGGEPDVVRLDPESAELRYVDCSAQTPEGRVSLCYDRDARVTRKNAAPVSSAIEMAASMGIEILTVEQYRALQALGEFDTTTSSWVATPPGIRELGGALFGDRRFDTVFIYHNGAQSYFSARGFRGSFVV
jgi:Protein of unknown function (DUF4256)